MFTLLRWAVGEGKCSGEADIQWMNLYPCDTLSYLTRWWMWEGHRVPGRPPAKSPAVFCFIKTGYRVLITHTWPLATLDAFEWLFLITFDSLMYGSKNTNFIRQCRNSSRSFHLQSRFWDVPFWHWPHVWCLSVTFQCTLVIQWRKGVEEQPEHNKKLWIKGNWKWKSLAFGIKGWSNLWLAHSP